MHYMMNSFCKLGELSLQLQGYDISKSIARCGRSHLEFQCLGGNKILSVSKIKSIYSNNNITRHTFFTMIST